MISEVHHVGIAVRDLGQALSFYCDALGLPLVKEGDIPARGVRAALLRVGRSHLELIQPTAQDSPPFARYIGERGEGLHHLALQTDDVAALVASLRGKGVPLTDGAPRDGFTGRLSYLAPEAMDGALLEVVEPPTVIARSLPPERGTTEQPDGSRLLRYVRNDAWGGTLLSLRGGKRRSNLA